MRIEFSAICEKGPVRDENQDRYMVSDFSTTVGGESAQGALRTAAGAKGILMAVADGMGGHMGGALAAELALRTVAESYSKRSRRDLLDRLKTAVEDANKTILKKGKGKRDLDGMGTTLTVVHLRGRALHLAHVGDTRIYLSRRGVLTPLTTDHNVLTKVMGIDPDEARKRVGGNILVQCIGGKTDELFVETSKLQLCRGDRILLCSDGLHGSVEKEQLARILTNADLTQACKYSYEAALSGGTIDNVTVLLAQITDPALPQPKWDATPRIERVNELIYDRASGQLKIVHPG